MSCRTVRRLTVAAALVLALSFAGPARAAAGSFEVAVPAVENSDWLDLLLGWFGSFWDNSTTASVDDKSTPLPVGGTGTSGAGAGTLAGSNPSGGPTLGEQGGMIDPDG